MRTLFTILLVAICLSVRGADTNAPAGDWLGKLEIDGVKLRLLFKIRKASEGSFVGVMDSIDQGAKDIAIDKISYTGNQLGMEIKLIEATFDGTYDPASDKFNGKLTQGSRAFPIAMDRVDARKLAAETPPPKDVAASKRAAEKLAGKWMGTLKSGSDEFHLDLNIRPTREGTATGTLDSPDQELRGIPLSEVTYNDGKVHFDVRGMTASYDGVSFNNSTTVTGVWKQARQTLPLNWTKSAKP